MTAMGSEKYVLVADADLSVMLTTGVYGLFAYQPLTPCVGLEFSVSGYAIVNNGVCGFHWVRSV